MSSRRMALRDASSASTGIDLSASTDDVGMCSTCDTLPDEPWPMLQTICSSSGWISELASDAISRSESSCRAAAFGSADPDAPSAAQLG